MTPGDCVGQINADTSWRPGSRDACNQLACCVSIDGYGAVVLVGGATAHYVPNGAGSVVLTLDVPRRPPIPSGLESPAPTTGAIVVIALLLAILTSR